MELPDDILSLIREYSKPMTRSNWRDGCYVNINWNKSFKKSIYSGYTFLYIQTKPFFFNLLDYEII